MKLLLIITTESSFSCSVEWILCERPVNEKENDLKEQK
jgi:hypothetical protein